MIRLIALLFVLVGGGAAIAQGGEAWLEEIRVLLGAASRGDAVARQKLDAAFAGEIPSPSRFFGPHGELGRAFYRYGAERGVPRAMYFLGNLYCSDLGDVKKDPKECDRWHREAAARGYALSMETLSAQYRYGPTKDLEQSRDWERRAAEAGNGQSMLYLARRYESGDEVPVNPRLAEYWYAKAEATGMETPASRKRKNAETVASLKAAVVSGDTDAMFALGRAYARGGYDGWGLPQSYPDAIHWYREAANRGHAVAANNLGAIYGRGLGVAVDFPQAMNWYRFAAERGELRAMYNLAGMLKRGEGSAADISAALAWYRLANDHIPLDPLQWPYEVRVLFDLIGQPCQLQRGMTRAELARAEGIHAELSAKMRSPLAPPERFTSSKEFREICG